MYVALLCVEMKSFYHLAIIFISASSLIITCFQCLDINDVNDELLSELFNDYYGNKSTNSIHQYIYDVEFENVWNQYQNLKARFDPIKNDELEKIYLIEEILIKIEIFKTKMFNSKLNKFHADRNLVLTERSIYSFLAYYLQRIVEVAGFGNVSLTFKNLVRV